MKKEELFTIIDNYPDIKALFDGSLELYLSYGNDDNFCPVSKLEPLELTTETGQVLNKKDIETIVDYGLLRDCHILCVSNNMSFYIPISKIDLLIKCGIENTNDQYINTDYTPNRGIVSTVSEDLLNNDPTYPTINIDINRICKDFDGSKNYAITPFCDQSKIKFKKNKSFVSER